MPQGKVKLTSLSSFYIVNDYTECKGLGVGHWDFEQRSVMDLMHDPGQVTASLLTSLPLLWKWGAISEVMYRTDPQMKGDGDLPFISIDQILSLPAWNNF